MEMEKRVAVEDVKVGMPATYYIGSDSYATEVEGVIRFKTGSRAGQVKAVVARNEGIFTLRPNGRLQLQGGHGGLVVGFARDYWDPSF